MNTSTRISLQISCKNLIDADTLSKSDPFAVLTSGDAGHTMYGRTETVQNNLNPVFGTAIEIDYYFESVQPLILTVTDDDGGGKGDKLLEVSFPLSKVMTSRGHALSITSGKATVTIVGVDLGLAAKDTVQLVLAARDLKNMDTFSKSDPFFVLKRKLPNGSLGAAISRSETIDDNLNPTWKPLPPIPMSKLASDVREESLHFDVFDEDVTTNELIGEVVCSVDALRLCFENKTSIPLHAKSETTGQLLCTGFKYTHVPTLSEMLSRGWQISLTVSIDFTASNGDPRRQNSLHCITGPPNQYTTAIRSVGPVLMAYDTDQQVPVFGFGGAVPGTEGVSHFFHVNMQPNPYVQGVDGVLGAYSSAIGSVRLSGPTNFAPTIQNVTAGALKASRVYTVLLIITDGEITDMNATVDAIVAADDAPLSIIIVGVGSCDFEAMNQLDGDHGALRGSEPRGSKGYCSRRDLVQFVPMRKAKTPEALSSEVLREVPDQISKWAMLTNAQL